MKSLLVLLLALYALVLTLLLFGATLAHATWPANARADAAVSAVAWKPVHVICYQTAAEWDARVRQAYNGVYSGVQVQAFTYVGSGTTEVSDQVCRTLFYALRVGPLKVTNSYALGRLIDVLAHEAQHNFGISSEATAEACAVYYFAPVAHVLFGTRYHTGLMNRLVMDALAYSRELNPAYQGGICTR